MKSLKESRYKISVDEIADAVRAKMRISGAETDDDSILRMCIEEASARISGRRSAEYTERYSHLAFCAIRRELGILDDYARDDSVTEIMVNGADNIFIERKNRIERADISFESPRRLTEVIQRICAGVGREFNDLHPIVDARLSDGSRVNAVHGNVAIGGPILTIRRFSKSRMSMDDLTEQGSVSAEAAAFLKMLVECGCNIIISGGTSSGKTSFLNVLSDYIPPDERIIVIEDSAELQIRSHKNLVRMESKPANAQGVGEVSIRELIKASLRMRPDRIIVGEVRGEEVIDMLAAMSTGHDGSLSTGHSNSSLGMLGRLETLVLAGSGFPADSIRRQIFEAIDFVIHLAKLDDGSRHVMEISEVCFENGELGVNRIFEYKKGAGLVRTGAKIQRNEKIIFHGKESGN